MALKQSAPAKSTTGKAVKASAPDARIDARIDAYMASSPPFARPILEYLRELVHTAVPDVTETMKWSRPFFDLNGKPLSYMAAFKAHLGFGFWSRGIAEQLRNDGIAGTEGGGSLGRITQLSDLPTKKQMLGYLRAAAEEIRDGSAVSSIAARSGRESARAPLPMPPQFAAALKQSKTAAKNYEAFPPSCKREYLEWIGSAKRAATRDRRAAQAVEQIAQGKRHNWQYASK